MSKDLFRTGVILGIIFCSLALANGLYEDQVGKFDWKQSYVGRVKYSHIDYSGKRVFVASENNVIASLNLVDGSLLWRKVLESEEGGEIHAMSVGNEVVTISGRGLVRGWNLKSGLLTYEWALTAESDSQWTLDTTKVYKVEYPQENHLEYTAFHIKTGSPVGDEPDTSQLPAKPKCVVDKGFVLCVGASGTYHIVRLSDGETSTGTVPTSCSEHSHTSLSSIASPYPAAVLSFGGGCNDVVIAVFHGKVLFLNVLCTSYAVRRTVGSPVVICATYKDSVYELQEMAFGEAPSSFGKPTELVHTSTLPKGTIRCFADISPDLHDTLVLIVGDDDSLIFVEKEKVEWVREEALANVITAEMVDLPVSDEEAAIEKEFANKEGGIIGMFWRRIQSQVMQAVNFPMSILRLRQPPEDSTFSLKKDQFGLHKLIILVTKSSKVFGLECEQGEIVWQYYMEDVTPISVLGKLTVPFYLHRTGRHFSLPPFASLIFKQKGSGLSALYTFNPITGQPLYDGLVKLDYKVKQSLLLPKEDEEFIKGLVIVSESDKVVVFPPDCLPTALALHSQLYMFTVHPESGLLQGYSFTRSSSKELGVLEVWNVRLSPPIIEVGIKNKAERVHSQGRVLGDRSVLYKYVNPNLIAVATATTDHVHKNLVTMYLIDSVTGAVIFTAAHKRAIPPIYIVHSENWVVYSFFNDKSRRTEVISLDLYEGKTQRNSTEFSSVTALPFEPFIERQAYILPHNVMAMRETITEKGITNKHVLVGVTTGSVVEVPWALLDPHRSPDGREEGVLPYTPDLTLPAEAILTYNHTLPHIEGILTSPSGLESTSLVLVYGLDLFYTRVAPSKTFDVLKDDFEYWLITLVLGGLISAAYISKRLASRKALRQAWK